MKSDTVMCIGLPNPTDY